MTFEVLQLSHQEAEQTIAAYMKERGLEMKVNIGLESERRYQCYLCQFRSNHPKFIKQHIATDHPNKAEPKLLLHRSKMACTPSLQNAHDGNSFGKYLMKSHLLDDLSKGELKSPALYNRSSLIQSDGSILLPDPSKIVYANFSSHPNFNPNRLFYCALCYRGYRWRYDVKRHHKTMHETPEDEAAMGLSMSPKSIKRRNKEFNRNFRYLEYVPQLDGLIPASMSSVHNSSAVKRERTALENETLLDEITDDDELPQQDESIHIQFNETRPVDVTEDEAAALFMIDAHKSDPKSLVVHDPQSDDAIIVFDEDRPRKSKEKSPSISFELNRSTVRPSSGFKPYRCPYCFYRTNWRTDSLRHIRARHKIEPTQDGYYEMTPEEAERTYANYERTFGFVVSKKVLGRFTEFRHMEWKELQRSIWEKIKDKPGYEQIIVDRLRPDDEPTPILFLSPDMTIGSANDSSPIKRQFACLTCAFQSANTSELEMHRCSTQLKVMTIDFPIDSHLRSDVDCQSRQTSAYHLSMQRLFVSNDRREIRA
jgi:hypothetical protein